MSAGTLSHTSAQRTMFPEVWSNEGRDLQKSTREDSLAHYLLTLASSCLYAYHLHNINVITQVNKLVISSTIGKGDRLCIFHSKTSEKLLADFHSILKGGVTYSKYYK